MEEVLMYLKINDNKYFKISDNKYLYLTNIL